MSKPNRKNKNQPAVKEVPKKSANEGISIPAGAVPQIVSQRVYDYIPIFFEALKEIHKELVAIHEELKEG